MTDIYTDNGYTDRAEYLARKITRQIKINSKELLRKRENRHGHQ